LNLERFEKVALNLKEQAEVERLSHMMKIKKKKE